MDGALDAVGAYLVAIGLAFSELQGQDLFVPHVLVLGESAEDEDVVAVDHQRVLGEGADWPIDRVDLGPLAVLDIEQPDVPQHLVLENALATHQQQVLIAHADHRVRSARTGALHLISAHRHELHGTLSSVEY